MTASVSAVLLLGFLQTDRRRETPTAKSQSPGESCEMDPRHAIHQRFNWRNKSHPTSWLNKLPLSWSLMIYGGCVCRCCCAETCASAEPKLAWVGGIGFSASHGGASDLFLLAPRRVWVLFLMSVSTKLRSAASEAKGFFFPTFPDWFGLQQEITREHLRTTAFGQKSTRAWHHSWSLVRGEESVPGLPEELCFSWEKPPAHLQEGWLFSGMKIQCWRQQNDKSWNFCD